MVTQAEPSGRRPFGWAGIVFSVLYVAAVMVLGSSVPEKADEAPYKDDPAKLAALWRAYYADSGHRWTIVVGAYVLIVAALAFVVFGNDLREFLAARGARTAAALVLAGAIIFATVTAVAAIVIGWIPGAKSFADAPIPRGEVNYLASQLGFGILLLPGGAAGALTLIAGGIGGTRSHALPAWLGWAGVVIGVVVFFLAAFFYPMALLALWVLVVGIVMLRRTASSAQRPVEPNP